ncbi:MAG: MOSC domain-containing protein [Pseudomonadales bacterium]|nr:MOSC domain-containing protein [Pseudomonadales bacterium]MBL6808720.1 MOSC domain-containing protein [Pseudomonadales bacterium]
MATLSVIFRYPVKSMGGESLEAAWLGPAGLPGDRGWALRPEGGGSVRGAKRYPSLMAFAARYEDAPVPGAPAPGVRLEAPDGQVRGSRDPDLAAWLSAQLGEAVALDASNPTTPFFDDAPLLLMTEASLQALEAMVPGGGEVRRFRPNLLLSGTGAGFPEEDWLGRRFQLGEAVLKVSKRCPRCIMTTLGFGGVPAEPAVLTTLRRARESCLGVYLEVLRPGRVQRHDALHWLKEEEI